MMPAIDEPHSGAIMAGMYENDIQKLYVAYLGRPADPDGLQFWEGAAEASHGNLADIATAFAHSAEYLGLTGGVAPAKVIQMGYQVMFGRLPDLGGFNFWLTAVQSGSLSADQVLTSMAAAAQGDDLKTFQAKVAYADTFTKLLDTPAEIQDYVTPGGLQAAVVMLSTVDASHPTPSTEPVHTGPVTALGDAALAITLVGIGGADALVHLA
jgi:hypothetical protein